MANKRPDRPLKHENPRQPEQTHQTGVPEKEGLKSKEDRESKDSTELKEGAESENETGEATSTPSPVRHWLKYAGIGASRSRQAPGGTAEIDSLGSLEAELLGLLWEIGRPTTSMELMEASLYKRRAQGQEPAAFATIATTLRRLANKGVLRSYKNEQRTPVYEPTIEREKMAARILNRVSETLLGQPLLGLLPHLTGGRSRTAGLSASDNDSLRRLVQALEDLEGSVQASEQAAAPGGGPLKPVPSSDAEAQGDAPP